MPTSSIEEYREQAQFIRVDNHNIACWQSIPTALDENQHKETIVFIHGFPSASWDWHHLWLKLADRYHLLAFDMLGFGLSDKPLPHQYSLQEQANIAFSVLAHHHVSDCHILAHDYGNSVAQEILTRAFERQEDPNFRPSIHSMCFLNGGLFAESHRPLFMQKLLKSSLGPLICRFMSKDSLMKSFLKIFGDKTPPSNYEIEVLWELLEYKKGTQVLHDLLSYIDERSQHRTRWVQAMQQTRVPLHFINGVQDPISGLHMLEQYQELIPNPQTTALDVGHYPQLEAPNLVLDAYTTFIEQHRYTYAC